jgi:hypothetical protein
MSPRTLERWRWVGKGPPYIRIAHVLYRMEDVKAYETSHLKVAEPQNSKLILALRNDHAHSEDRPR